MDINRVIAEIGKRLPVAHIGKRITGDGYDQVVVTCDETEVAIVHLAGTDTLKVCAKDRRCFHGTRDVEAAEHAVSLLCGGNGNALARPESIQHSGTTLKLLCDSGNISVVRPHDERYVRLRNGDIEYRFTVDEAELLLRALPKLINVAYAHEDYSHYERRVRAEADAIALRTKEEHLKKHGLK